MKELSKEIAKRKSRRTYLRIPLEENEKNKINELIKSINQESGLKLELKTEHSKYFSNLKKTYGLFSGVENYIIMKGVKDDENFYEKIGYFGEKIVLKLTKMGLGTCWVGLSFDKDSCLKEIRKEEKFALLITLGYVNTDLSFKEKMIENFIKLKNKNLEDIYTTDNVEEPRWFREGLRAVLKAPSAMNKKPVMIDFIDGEVSARISEIEKEQYIDLGIAKLHFEIASGIGKFEWGNDSKIIFNEVSAEEK